jgi:hypothetical protein
MPIMSTASGASSSKPFETMNQLFDLVEVEKAPLQDELIKKSAFLNEYRR